MTDFDFQFEGTISVLTPKTNEAREWVASNLQGEIQYWGKGVVIEHRYVSDILNGVMEAGLVVAMNQFVSAPTLQ